MIYFCFSLLSRVPGGAPGASQSPRGCQSLGAPLALASMAGKGGLQTLQALFRVTVPSFWKVSQCILFTAASTNHETELLEV